MRRRLHSDEVFLEYLLGDTMSVVFALTSDSIAALDLHIGAKALSRLVDFARGTIASGNSDGQELWRSPLQRLHEYLIGPVERAGLLEGSADCTSLRTRICTIYRSRRWPPPDATADF